MKHKVRITLITLSLVLIALVPAYAQKTSATVNIPFSFTVDDIRMPPGEYVVSSPTEHAVSLQHVGGPEAKTAMTNNGSSAPSDGRAKLSSTGTGTPTSCQPPGCRTRTTPASSTPQRAKFS